MENSKIVNLDALDKIAKELRRKALADISQQEEEIEEVRDMFGGKSFRYVLQEEYDNLSEEEKNDPSIVWNIIDAEEPVSKEYVDEEVAKINDMLQHMGEGIKTELDKKSNILNYSDHTLNGTETYNNLEKVIGEGSEAIYTINKPINLIEGTTCSVEVKFSDNTNLLLQEEVISIALHEKQVNCIQITGGTAGLMVIDKARYTIKDSSGAPEHDDNVSSLLVFHPNANNVISLTITKPTVFEINNSFFTNYQFVNDTEKENWNNKADKNELFSGDYNDLINKPSIPNIEGLATESFVIDKIANVSEKFIDVVIDNNNIDIISSFSDTAKIARKINVGPDGRNNVVNFDTVSLIYNDGRTESIYSTTDDTAPIRAQFGYIGGNHGHLGFTLKSNGQTQEDVGSIWTDGTTDYVLAKVQDDKCYFAYNQYRLSSGKLMYNKKDADANLTPKSGATNTNSLDISTRVTSVQLYPSINRHTIEYYFDDKKVVTPNGSYKCDKFAIKEQYNVMKFDAMHEFLTTHIGSNLNDDAIDGFATFTITYEFTKGCKCNIYHSLEALDIIELTNTGFIQQAYGFNSNYTVSKIIPGVGTVDNFNFATGVNLKNITKEINIYRNNLINEDASVSRDVNIAYKDSIPQFIFTNGYLIDKTDSAKRKDYINEDLCLWKINASNKKTYPVAVNGMTLNEGDYLSFSMYRNFNPINDNVTSFNMIKNGEDIYFMIDNLDTVVTNIILDEYIGERLEILESNNFELLSDTIDSNGLRFRGTDVSYAILKITKDPQTGEDCDLTGLQTKEDEGLNTEDKTIVGAINELESEVFDIAANVISMDVYKADKTYVDEQLSNVTNNGITEAELDLLLEEIFGINNKNELTSVRL